MSTEHTQHTHNNALDEIIAQRYAEIDEIRKMGIAPYPNRCEKQISCLDAKNAAEGTEAVTAGRLMQLRLMDPTLFLKNISPWGILYPLRGTYL